MRHDAVSRKLRPAGLIAAVIAALIAALPAAADNFTTAAEVRPILAATKANWVAVREFDGKDLLYFTQLESWRCGVREIRYSVNSTAAAKVREVEPCYKGTASPNAFKDNDHLPYIELPLGSITTVSVVVVYDDGTEDRGDFTRAQVQMN